MDDAVALKATGTESAEALIDSLTKVLGSDRVLTGEADRLFYSQDVHARAAEPATAVIRPGDVESLARAVGAATGLGAAIFPRGGGMSYTEAYLPTRPLSVVVDTSDLNRITALDTTDMYVTVEPGVTWAALDEALKAHGLRTPFWGPFSGHSATVGGSLSQNSVTYGSAKYGPASDSVIGYEIITAEGAMLRTGPWGSEHGLPFFRHYGPDLTGLFSGDAGALGIKARITLRLMKRSAATGGLSFGFEDFEGMAGAMAAVAREGLVSESFGLDPVLMAQNLGRENVEQDFKTLLKVGQAGRGPVDGVLQMAKVVLAGRGYLKKVRYSAHWTLDAPDEAGLRSMIRAVRKAASPFGHELENSVPTIIRAFPFPPPTQILGPKGERWVPLHGILPFSRMAAFKADLDAFYAGHQAEMDRLGIKAGAMFTTIDTSAFLYEIAYYWPDARAEFHERAVPGDWIGGLPTHQANPEAYALVDTLKSGAIDIFHRHGAAHMQVGKLYPLMRGRDAGASDLLRALKAHLDPQGLMNPGALGL